MKYTSEVEIMNALGIESWRNLSKSKMIEFASMMPEMDTEVALKVVEQFPEFTRFALEMLDGIEKRHESTLVHNEQSQQNVHRAYEEIRRILKRELTDAELTWDQKKYIMDLIMETGNREFAKDSENKQFLDDWFTRVAVAGAGVLLAGVVAIGGRAVLKDGFSGVGLPFGNSQRS